MEQEEIIEQLQQEMTELREVNNKNRMLEQAVSVSSSYRQKAILIHT